MNYSHVLHKKNKKTYVRISVKILAMFYLLFLIGHQLQTPTTAYYSNSNTLEGTLVAMNDFGEDEIVESSEADEKDTNEELKEEESKEEANEEINEIENKEEANEELDEEENIEEIEEELNEVENTKDSDSSNKSDLEESNEN